MTNRENSSDETGNAISPKHFIYLDRGRLLSYASQIMDGVPQIRRLLELESRRIVDTPVEKQGEIVKQTSGEGGMGFGVKGMLSGDGKGGVSETVKRGYKSSEPSKIFDSMTATFDDKADLDNLYLLLEKQLTEANLLIDADTEEFLGSQRLIKITGTARFFDWQSVLGLLENPEDLIGAFDDDTRKAWASNKKNARALTSIMKHFSLGRLTIMVQQNEYSLVSSLNPTHLCMTMDQLRAGYVMSGDVEVTIVGFIPKRTVGSKPFSGIAGMLDMRQLWEALIGTVDYVIDPIVVYGKTDPDED